MYIPKVIVIVSPVVDSDPNIRSEIKRTQQRRQHCIVLTRWQNRHASSLPCVITTQVSRSVRLTSNLTNVHWWDYLVIRFSTHAYGNFTRTHEHTNCEILFSNFKFVPWKSLCWGSCDRHFVCTQSRSSNNRQTSTILLYIRPLVVKLLFPPLASHYWRTDKLHDTCCYNSCRSIVQNRVKWCGCGYSRSSKCLAHFRTTRCRSRAPSLPKRRNTRTDTFSASQYRHRGNRWTCRPSSSC